MKYARWNRSALTHSTRSVAQSTDPKYPRRYSQWHWGLPMAGVKRHDDPLFPAHMIEIGRLVELWLRTPEGNGVNGTSTKIILEDSAVQRNHVVFDPNHKAQRIYFVLSPDVKAELRTALYDPKNTMPLQELAALGGGRHAKMKDYPNVRVTPVGLVTHVTYLTKKKGDDAELVNGKVVGPGSNYIHHMGEEGGVPPFLGIDATGRLWYAAGSYQCPTPGISY